MYIPFSIIGWFFIVGSISGIDQNLKMNDEQCGSIRDILSALNVENKKILCLNSITKETKNITPKKAQADTDLQCNFSQDLIDEIVNQYKLSLKNKVDNRSILDLRTVSYNSEFDLVVSISCFHLIEDQQNMLRNIAQSLKPGGKLLIVMLGKANQNTILKDSDNPFFKSFIKVAYETKKWMLHFQNVDIDSQIFPQDPESFKHMLDNAGLKTKEIKLMKRCKAFEDVASLAIWLGHVVQDVPSIAELSPGIQDQFIEDVVAEYVTHVPIGIDGSIEYVVPALIIHAQKPQS